MLFRWCPDTKIVDIVVGRVVFGFFDGEQIFKKKSAPQRIFTCHFCIVTESETGINWERIV